jgi:hypothetical protein
VGPERRCQGQQIGHDVLGQVGRQAVAVLQGLAQDLGKGGVGRPALGVALPEQGLATRDLNLGGQLTNQARLAHARLAADQEDLALARRSPVP